MKNEYTKRHAFEMLGLKPGVDEKTVREEYRRLAKKYHPDCALTGGESCEKFLEVQKAYETLCGTPEDEKGPEIDVKQQYSTAQRQRRRQGMPRAEETWSFSPASLFDSFFGPSVDLEIELSPREARFGTAVSLELPIESSCPRCNGRGSARMRICRACGGSGRIVLSRQFTAKLPARLSDGDLVEIPLPSAGSPNLSLYALVRVR